MNKTKPVYKVWVKIEIEKWDFENDQYKSVAEKELSELDCDLPIEAGCFDTVNEAISRASYLHDRVVP